MQKEEYLNVLLKDLYENETVNVYDHCATTFGPTSEEFAKAKCFVDQLVREKLASFTDRQHTTIQLSNFGRYWAIKGGYEAYLTDGQYGREKERPKEKSISEKERLIEARLKLTHYRLMGFWLALIISCVGFALSMINLYLIVKGKK